MYREGARLALRAICSFTAASARLAWSAPGRERLSSSAWRALAAAFASRARAAASWRVSEAPSSASFKASVAACLRVHEEWGHEVDRLSSDRADAFAASRVCGRRRGGGAQSIMRPLAVGAGCAGCACPLQVGG